MMMRRRGEHHYSTITTKKEWSETHTAGGDDDCCVTRFRSTPLINNRMMENKMQQLINFDCHCPLFGGNCHPHSKKKKSSSNNSSTHSSSNNNNKFGKKQRMTTTIIMNTIPPPTTTPPPPLPTLTLIQKFPFNSLLCISFRYSNVHYVKYHLYWLAAIAITTRSRLLFI